jgi:hypothetical protein
MKAKCYFSGKWLHLNKLKIFIIIEKEKKRRGVVWQKVYTFTYDTYARLVNVKYLIAPFENVKIMCCILVQ